MKIIQHLRTPSILLWACFLASCAVLTQSSEIIFASSEQEKRSVHEDWGSEFMVVSQGPYSSLAGEQMFKRGGNFIDAAAAVTFTISVERPQSTGIGGGGFALMRMKSEDEQEFDYHAVDFREKAPLGADSKMFLDDKGQADPLLSRQGPLSVGVPGLVAGIVELHEKHGKLPLAEVMRPAITLARTGFPVYPELAFALNHSKKKLSKYPSSTEIFFKDLEPLEVGDILIQRDLANTLQKIALNGAEGFYRGPVAEQIVNSSYSHGGLITHEDLEHYDVLWREPIVGTYKGLKVLSMPPPSSGGAHIIQILNILENEPLKRYGVYDPRTIHLVSSAMQQAFADRATHMGDSDFVDVPLKKITSKEYASSVRKMISDKKARKVDEVSTFDADSVPTNDHTTHFTIADGQGNIFSSTQTINGYFGSGIVAEGSGVVLNNEMDDFAAKAGAKNLFGAIGGDANLVEPQKRPLSSMSPTIVIDPSEGDRPVLSLGSPSGTRILTCVANTIMNHLDHGLDLFDSVMAVRYHHQWRPDYIRVDEPGFPDSVVKTLNSWGHEVKTQNLGCRVQAISFEKDGSLHGVSDMRGQGMSRGR